MFTVLLCKSIYFEYQVYCTNMSATETITRPVQPDIQYHPEYEKYKARSLRRKETETLPTTLPDGFPLELKSPLVWEGKDIEKQDDWLYHLSNAELDEIEAALQHFKCMFLILHD